MLTKSLPLARIRAGSVSALLAAVGSVGGPVGGSVGASAVGLVGLPALGVLALAGTTHCAMAQCGPLELSQSTDPDTIQPGRAVWCGSLETNAETQIGRGFTAPYNLTISCVTFGVTSNTGAEWPCHVRIRGGTITAPYATLPVLAETTVMIPAGTSSQFFTAALPPVFVPAGAPFVVELDTPSRVPADGGDGALLSLGFNGLGQSSPTYLRAPGCGANNYIDTGALGFPNSHAAVTVGVIEGYAVPVLGGFPVSPIGTVSVGTAGGEVVAYSDGSTAPFGLSIGFGDLTMGMETSFRAISMGDEVDPTLAIAFKNLDGTHSDRIVFRTNPASDDEAVLDLDFDTLEFDRFNLHVFREGELVGTLADQTSGSVRFAGPDYWPFIVAMLSTGVASAGCFPGKTTYFESGGIKSEEGAFYGIRIGSATVGSTSGGGPSYTGDEIWIESVEPASGMPAPAVMELSATGILGLAVDVDAKAPRVGIGAAQSSLRSFGDLFVARTGISFKAINAKGVQSGSMYATELTGDGVADLRYVPGLGGEGEGVRMELSGVESASIGMDLTVADPLAACMTVCSFEVGPVSIPTGKTMFDPWPVDPMFVAVQPDFTGVGDETYTFQAYDASGTLVHEETGLQGIAGGASRWPSKIGKLGGATPCFVMCYPDLTLFRMAGGHEFDVHEVRVLVEGAPPAGPLSALDIAVGGMDEVRLFDPVTELPDFAEPCYADLDGDGVLTIFDFLAFQNLFATGSPDADCDEDGALTLFDFLCFQNAFAMGCP